MPMPLRDARQLAAAQLTRITLAASSVPVLAIPIMEARLVASNRQRMHPPLLPLKHLVPLPGGAIWSRSSARGPQLVDPDAAESIPFRWGMTRRRRVIRRSRDDLNVRCYEGVRLDSYKPDRSDMPRSCKDNP